MEVDELAALAVDAAMAAGADSAEGYAARSTGRHITVFEGEVESLSTEGGHGVGVRVLAGGAEGYAYTSGDDPDDVREAARRAVDNAAVTEADPALGLPDRAAAGTAEPLADIWAPGVGETPTAAKIALAQAIEAAARAADSRITTIEQTVYAEDEDEVAIASSTGVAGSFRRSSCYAYLYAFAEEDGDLMTGLAVTVGRAPGELDPEGCGREAAARATRVLGAAPCPSFRGPLVFDPLVAASLIGIWGGMCSAEAAQRGRTPFAGRLGERIGQAGLALVDDGRARGGLSSRPFDGEGVATRRTAILDDGTLAEFLHDTVTARREGRRAGSTGNAVRSGYASGPSVGTTNLILTGGGDLSGGAPSDLIAGIGDGLYVTDVTGLNAGVNAISGDFSVGAVGLRIRDGALAEPVREVTVAGNLVAMLAGVAAVADDARWVPFGGSVLAPTIRVDGMTVSGR